MKLVFTDTFRRDYQTLPAKVQRALDKALTFLLANPRHHSLRAKKIQGTDTSGMPAQAAPTVSLFSSRAIQQLSAVLGHTRSSRVSGINSSA